MSSCNRRCDPESRAAARRPGWPCAEDPVGEALEAYLNALTEFGCDSGEARAARIFLHEIVRRRKLFSLATATR